MATPEELRQRGFRPVRPGPGRELIRQRSEGYGYEAEAVGTALWLRKRYRKRGVVVPSPITLGPTIRGANLGGDESYDFLHRYRQTSYSRAQRRLQVSKDQLVDMVRSAQEEPEPYRHFDSLTKAAALAPPELLEEVLKECVLPAFFTLDPHGAVQILLLDDGLERDFGLLRGTYALQHYTLAEVRTSDRGIATLRDWETGQPINYVDALLSVLQVATYPYVPMFHGGPVGLWFVFLLSTPERHEPGPFPRSWLHWARSEAGFAQERVDGVRALGDADSMEYRQLSHRRYCFEAPVAGEIFHELLMWAVDRLGVMVREVADPANFEDHEGYVDFTFALEHNLSLLRILKRVLWALSTEEPPAGKFYAFEVADLLDRLARAFGKTKNDGELFKLLFNPIEGRRWIEEILEGVPGNSRGMLQGLARRLYADLKGTVLASIWVPDKRRTESIRVRTADLTDEREESEGEFVGNLVRALRNTHHGYFTRLDQSARPSLYLVLSTGDIPDSVSTLPLIWLVAFLANPERTVGWRPLGVAAYE